MILVEHLHSLMYNLCIYCVQVLFTLWIADFQPRLNLKSVSHALDLFPSIRHFQRDICYVYVMYMYRYVMKKNCNLYFWKISH
jgi:hypothetical protein